MVNVKSLYITLYRQVNPEYYKKTIQYNNAWARRNPEKQRDYVRRYQHKNKEELKDYRMLCWDVKRELKRLGVDK